ncbi:MAG: ArsR family transcriptional regulator [Candidatus Didemnitutus sp.]|nr:ArsR family transcriptional regulator [Candidatus Didemnitutus sp.]
MASEPKSAGESAAVDPAELERDIIAFWIRVAALFGYSRSIGEIFGLIFLSEAPLCADDIAERLNMSRSGVGQGLKTLQEIGAIRPAHQPASRKEYFRMQTDLGVLAKQILNARVFPTLEELAAQKAALAQHAKTQGSPHLMQRFDKLQRWQDKAAPVLAVLKSLA